MSKKDTTPSKMEKCIQLIISTSKTQNEIAKEIGIAPETLSRWKKRKDYQEMKERYERIYLNDLSTNALKELKKLVSSAKSEFVKLGAIQDVLNRVGLFDTLTKEEKILKNEKTAHEIEKIKDGTLNNSQTVVVFAGENDLE